MARNKAKKADAKPADSKTSAPSGVTPSAIPNLSKFNRLGYASGLGLHLWLMAFVSFYMPVSSMNAFSGKGKEQTHTLTENPVLTAAYICGGILILQMWWAGWIRDWWFVEPKGGTEAEIRIKRMEYDANKIYRISLTTAMTLLASLCISGILVMFGSPVKSHHAETYLLALLTSLLIIYTPLYTLGMPSLGPDLPSLMSRLNWTRLFAELKPKTSLERAIVFPSVGAILGCWCGAIPLALDWDEPWQAWPLPCVYGSLGGYAIGSISALVVGPSA